VSEVDEDFERELAGWRVQYAGRPDLEMLRLALLSLEREEIVAVAYREDVLGRRLAAMPLSDDVREVIRHALLWAWWDEEMHAVYIRGMLLRLGDPWLKGRALAVQMAGALGGWAASVRQHVRWRDAPFSRAIATLVTAAGIVLGKVPRAVRSQLDYASFRAFCIYNAAAERTAWLCWDRVAALAAQLPGYSSAQVEEFRRVALEEDRHRRMFEIIAGALTEDDRLAEGDAADLAARLGEVSEFFLARTRRTGPASRNPLGTGAPVWVLQGSSPAEKRSLFRDLLERSDLAGRLRTRAAELGKEADALRVAIKPTFMLGYDRRDLSIVTDPELLEELALFVRGQGCADVAVVESSNVYDRFYRNRGVPEVARYLGFESPHYRLVDASAEQVPHRYFRGMAQYSIGRTWKEADYRITFAKMRSHPVEMVYLTVPNVEWVGARCDEFLFLDRQAHRETAILMLLDEFPPDYALLDGYDLAADGLVGVMGCPRPRAPRRLYASGDALALDRVAGRHIGLLDPRDSTILRAAEQWFGGSGAAPSVIGPDEPVPGWRSPYHDEISTVLSLLAFPVYVLGSGRGALFVAPMDEEAFPVLGDEGLLLRAGRRAVQRLIGIGPLA
jgi:uncharacterized protein (DUF362 family)